MSALKVNRDMLAAYLEGELSPDAARALRLELARDPALRRALEQERRLLASLDALPRVEPPEDFVAAVMGRVAQQPAHRPRTRLLPAAAVGGAVAAAGAVGLFVLALAGALWATGVVDGALLGSWLARGLAGGIDAATSGLHLLREWLEPARVLLEESSKMAWRLLTAGSPLARAVQAGLLLFTLSLNYALTRLVLDYQRRR